MPASFTLYFREIVDKMECDVTVRANERSVTVKALWDTGATITVISREVADALELTPYRAMGLRSATTDRPEMTVTYGVEIDLPGNMRLTNWEVALAKIGNQGIGLLIGMDIITHGDFAVSNLNGKTVMSFRIPSQEITDYTERKTE